MIRPSATTCCRARRVTTCAPNCSTSIRTAFYIGPNLEWVPQSYFVDSANTLKTEPYAIWGLKAGVDNGGTYSVYVEARNIGNKAYIASASIIDRANPALPLFEPGTGRAVYAGVKARW